MREEDHISITKAIHRLAKALRTVSSGWGPMKKEPASLIAFYVNDLRASLEEIQPQLTESIEDDNRMVGHMRSIQVLMHFYLRNRLCAIVLHEAVEKLGFTCSGITKRLYEFWPSTSDAGQELGARIRDELQGWFKDGVFFGPIRDPDQCKLVEARIIYGSENEADPSKVPQENNDMNDKDRIIKDLGDKCQSLNSQLESMKQELDRLRVVSQDTIARRDTEIRKNADWLFRELNRDAIVALVSLIIMNGRKVVSTFSNEEDTGTSVYTTAKHACFIIRQWCQANNITATEKTWDKVYRMVQHLVEDPLTDILAEVSLIVPENNPET